MLDSNIKTQLKTYLERLQRPIELVATTSASSSSQDMAQLLQDIAECSSLVTVRLDGQSTYAPSFTVGPKGEEARVRFAGLPMGHEFTSLVLALLQAGGVAPKESPEALAQLDALSPASSSLNFEVFVSLSCHNCPDVVQALNLMALRNGSIKAVTVDGALFQEEVEKREVLAVPAVFLNGQLFGTGRMLLEEILAKLDTGSAERDTQRLNEAAPFDVLVVGGGPAGAAAAVYAARKGIRTGVLAERMGGQVNDTLDIENYISVQKTEGPRMAADLEAHVRQYGVEVISRQKAAKVTAAPEVGGFIEVETESGARVKTRALVLATGARWRNLNVPGEAEYKNKGVAYCPHCDGPLFKGKRVAVVGGGNSGVEAAIDLAGVVSHVTLLEFGAQLRADAVLVAKLKSLPNVTVLTSAQTVEIEGDGSRVNGLRYIDRESNQENHVQLEGVFVQIGLVPNTEFLKGAVELNKFGEIVVDPKGHTNVPGVFAAGDATTVPYKQIVVAAGEGAKAALSAFDHLIRS